MPKESVADIIAKAQASGDYASIKQFDGQVLTFVGFESKTGTNGEYLIIDALTGDAEEVQIRTGAAQVVEILKGLDVNGLLPYDLKVVSFATQHATRGYTLEEV